MKFKTWQTGCFKLPHLESPHFQMGSLSAVASGLILFFRDTNFELLCLCCDLRTRARFEGLVCQGEINLWSWGFQDQSIFPLKAKKEKRVSLNNFLSTFRLSNTV